MRLLFKEAKSDAEMRQIHALNHRVFAFEVGQHPCQASGLLIDRFHAENHYFIAICEGCVAGMVSAHAGPEFSLVKRLPDPRILASFPRPLEVRLLAIEPLHRNALVLSGLLWQAYRYAVSGGFSHILISAIDAREKMYRRLGFLPLGPAVPDGSASFLPMALSIHNSALEHRRRVARHERRFARTDAVA